MDPISALQNAVALVRQVKAMVDTLKDNEIEITVLKDILNQITSWLVRAEMCSASVFPIIQNLLDLIGDRNSGLLGYITKYEQKQANPSVFSLLGRFVSGSGVKNDLEQHNKKLDRVLQNLIGALSMSTNINLKQLVNSTNSQSMENIYQMDPVRTDFEDNRCELGRGAFAATYRVKSTNDNQLYAMKRAEKSKISTSGVSLDMLKQEVQILIALTHPHIIRYFISFDSHSGRFYNIVMELAEEGNLADKVKVSPAPSMISIKKWFVQCLSALQYMHEEKYILHRDIKPENILLSADMIKLADLGLACVAQSTLSNHSVIGTLMYASYEKAHGLSYDGRDDVWGLGCVFAEVVTRKRLNEWGGALYLNNAVEVIRRKQNIVDMCRSNVGLQYKEVADAIVRALENSKELRPTARLVLQNLSVVANNTAAATPNGIVNAKASLPVTTTSFSTSIAASLLSYSLRAPANVTSTAEAFDNNSLPEAVKLFCANKQQAIEKHGPISAWNTSKVTTMNGLFKDQIYFNEDISAWDVSNVTDMGCMFNGARSFNQPLEHWNVSNVMIMYSMFNGASSFNQPLEQWNVSNVTDMGDMFYGASSFNQPLEQWNVSNVTDMRSMFCGASCFNQPLEKWNVSNVTIMYSMFNGASSFNQPLEKWNASNVTSMYSMFYNASSFNQPLEKWNVSNVTSMYSMFYNTSSFNRPLEKWNVSNVTNMESMFYRASSFNQPLEKWNVSNVTKMGSMFTYAGRATTWKKK